MKFTNYILLVGDSKEKLKSLVSEILNVCCWQILIVNVEKAMFAEMVRTSGRYSKLKIR